MRPGFDDLAGKRVLVTGASSGIGAAVARGFAACGAVVGIHYHRGEARARELLRAIEAEGGRGAVLQADLGDPAAPARLAAEAAAALGGIDVLINNAGGITERRAFSETDDALYDSLFDTNVRAVASLIRASLPWLKASGSGAVISTTSLAYRTGGGPGTVLYAATKGALTSMTAGLAKELGPMGIRVNIVAPGMILTPLHDKTPPEVLERIRTQVPLGRLGTVEDCVGAYLFLASPRLAGYVSGAVLEVGGGRI